MGSAPMIDVGYQFTYEDESYTIAALIESGGIGSVYRADLDSSDGLTGKPDHLAIKVLQAAHLADEEYVKRLRREIAILANIDHPNVVQFRGFLENEDGSVALIMEFVEGAQRMNEYVAAQSEDEYILHLILQALYALRAAHVAPQKLRYAGALGMKRRPPAPPVVHRDVSPGNLLVSFGKVYLIDFGLARRIDSRTALTSAGRTLGTVGCMAPEQIEDPTTAEPRSDLFGLGRSFAAAMQQRRPIYALPHELPHPWAGILSKLSKHDVADRYDSAEGAINAILEAAIEAGILLEDPEDIGHIEPIVHFTEFAKRWETPPSSWADFVQHQLLKKAKLDLKDLRCALLVQDVVLNQITKADEVVSRLIEDVGKPVFIDGVASFSSADVLGDWAIRWYPALRTWDTSEELFRLTVRVAVDYHRYHVMGCVRKLIMLERAEDRQRLRDWLSEEDPGGVVRST